VKEVASAPTESTPQESSVFLRTELLTISEL
jgi:hypothetical protein